MGQIINNKILKSKKFHYFFSLFLLKVLYLFMGEIEQKVVT